LRKEGETDAGSTPRWSRVIPFFDHEPAALTSTEASIRVSETRTSGKGYEMLESEFSEQEMEKKQLSRFAALPCRCFRGKKRLWRMSPHDAWAKTGRKPLLAILWSESGISSSVGSVLCASAQTGHGPRGSL